MIRKITKNDIEEVLDLLHSYSDNTHIDYNYIINDMKNNYSNYYVFEQDNKIIGMINYHRFEMYAEIIDIVVKKQYRRMHIGTKLLEHAINSLKNYNVTLEVKEDNVSAIKLYESQGFKKVSTRKKYYGDKDAYIMSKKVSE